LTFQRPSPTIPDVAARKMKKTWGGARPGAGRKRQIQDPVRFTFDFERADFEALEAISREQGITTAEAIRRALRAHLRRRGRV
jgi:Ribbon-helix-helix protein, copG family